MIYEIEEHFKKEYPREGCGVIAIVKGSPQWFPCTNIAEDDNDFIISHKEYLEIRKKYDILAIVHSHIDQSNEPSVQDVNSCNALGIPYHIYSYPDMDLNIVEPKKNFYPLIGREYEFGVRDCFEALRDWLAEEKIHIPPREPFEEDFYEKQLNYFSEDYIKNWSHKKVEGAPQKNDVLIFQVESKLPNHCGVYLQDGIFYHHAVNRLSCREPLHPFWMKYLVGIYRYEA